MAVHDIPPPDQIEAAFQRTLSNLAELTKDALNQDLGWKPDDLAMLGWRAIYTLGLPSLQNGDGLSGARQIGWQLLARHSNGSAVSLEVNQLNPADPVPQLATVSWGPVAEKPVEAAEFLKMVEQQDDRLKNQEFEARVLRLPSIHVEAMWLHSATDQGDLVIPSLTYELWGQEKALLEVDDFVAKLRSLAASIPQRPPIPRHHLEHGKDRVKPD